MADEDSLYAEQSLQCQIPVKYSLTIAQQCISIQADSSLKNTVTIGQNLLQWMLLYPHVPEGYQLHTTSLHSLAPAEQTDGK